MKAFEVLHPGVHTTLQDLGRPGFMRFGIPASGAADRFAARAANLLLANAESAALLEIVLFRLELLALEDLAVVVTGGDLSPLLNDRGLPMWQAASLKKGDRLFFQGRKAGLRGYLAVRGGFAGPEFLGSRSVFTRGLMGRPLQAGEVLETCAPACPAGPLRRAPPELIPGFSPPHILRVLLGPQEDRFTSRGVATLLDHEYSVSSQSDRMGYRLQGPPIEHCRGPDIISEPIAPGAIQVPGDGQPIIILWDAQVSGGYVKIASVIGADLDRLAQIMPGEKLRFRPVSLDEAQEALHAASERLGRLAKFLGA